MRVSLSRRQTGMTEHFLKRAKVGAAFEHVRRARMPERVRVQIGATRSGSAVPVRQFLDPSDADASASLAHEQRGWVEPSGSRITERGTHGEIPLYGGRRFRSERNDAFLVALSRDAHARIVE